MLNPPVTAPGQLYAARWPGYDSDSDSTSPTPTNHSFSPSPDTDTTYSHFNIAVNLHLPHLIEWLHLRKLLDQLSENQTISNNALQLIIGTVFLSAKHFITHLYKHNDLDGQQIKTIYNVLKNDMSNSYFSDNYKSKTYHSSFNVLSIPSITNICSYLTKDDILSFKNTSINIAIIALNEMQKYKIGVFNMNELLFHNHYNNFALFKQIKTRDTIKMERYAPSIKFNKIIDVWAKKYNIDPMNMALIYNETDYEESHIDPTPFRALFIRRNEPLPYFMQYFIHKTTKTCHVITNNVDISECTAKQMKGKQFLVLDKRKISIIYDIENDTKYNDCEVDTGIIYDVTKEWSCNKCTFINLLSKGTCDMCSNHIQSASVDTIVSKYNHQYTILLNYFNLKQQKITYCRALIVNRNYTTNELKRYIEKNINILISDHDEDLSQLVIEMKKYNAQYDIKESMISIYKYSLLKSNAHGYSLLKSRDEYGLRHYNDILCNEEEAQHCFQVFVFQLNSSHHLMSIADNNYISKLRSYYCRMLNECFCANPMDLMENIYKRLKWKNNELIPDFGGNNITLSPFLTTHICSYLNKKDIIIFKMVSSATAMICLKEMRKVNIGSFYIHNMETIHEYNNFLTFKDIKLEKLINYTRFHRESAMKDLCTFWCQQYNIPHNHLLILLIPKREVIKPNYIPDSYDFKAPQLLSSEGAKMFDITRFNKMMYMKAKHYIKENIFLIFDKRKLCFIDAKDDIYKILLLHYFDFINEKISFCKPLVITKHPFIAQTGNHKAWGMDIVSSFIAKNAFELVSESLSQTLCKMGEINDKQNRFKFYQTLFGDENEIKYCRIKNERSVSFIENVIFQLNDEHDLFLQTHCVRNPQILFCEAESVTMHYVSNGILLGSIMRYFGSTVHCYPIDYTFKLKISPNTKAKAICKMISQRFQNVIPNNQIQLLINDKRMKSNQSLIDIGLFEWSKSEEQYIVKYNFETKDAKILKFAELYWTIIPSDWVHKHIAYDSKIIMYNINVYTPNDSYLGEEYETTLPNTKYEFYVPFKKKFIVKELILYIGSICNGMYRERYKSLLKYFRKGHTDCDRYSVLISAGSGSAKELMENCYEYNCLMKYNVNINNKISLFIVSNNKYKKNNSLEQYPVIVRFKKKEYHAPKEYYRNIGRPERIWINKSNLLSKIKGAGNTPPSLILYNNGLLSLINVKVYCFYNQVSPPVSTKRLLKNDVNLHRAIFRKQFNSNINHVLLVTVT